MNDFTQRPTGHPDTVAVHCGEKRWMGSITTPIDYTSTFVFKNVAEMVAFANGHIDHYEYGRYGNPTRQAAELKLAALEGPETLVTHPALNSYYNISREERYTLGIIDELVRLLCRAGRSARYHRRSGAWIGGYGQEGAGSQEPEARRKNSFKLIQLSAVSRQLITES